MWRYLGQRHRFDRLFMAHLGSLLRAEYEPLVRSPLPKRHEDLVLSLAEAASGSELHGRAKP